MKELLKKLCLACGTSGREDAVRELILNEIKGFAEVRVDPLGNIIAEKKGKRRAAVRVTADAHTDEVGIIASSVNERGFVKFHTVGGIEVPSLLSKRFVFENGARGVVCIKPVHLCSKEESSKLPEEETLVLDIGAASREEALKMISIGETAVFEPDFSSLGDLFVSKAIDDRAGCAVLITLLKEEAEYDFTATFSVQEEIGLRGARTAAFNSNCEVAVIVEGTTAADIPSNSGGDRVCEVGKGAVLSFMDRATMYDRRLYLEGRRLAEESGIKCQTKTKVAGGNNSGAFHTAMGGVRTAAVSLPCRYIHSSSSVASFDDLENVYRLTKLLIEKAAAGEI